MGSMVGSLGLSVKMRDDLLIKQKLRVQVWLGGRWVCLPDVFYESRAELTRCLDRLLGKGYWRIKDKPIDK